MTAATEKDLKRLEDLIIGIAKGQKAIKNRLTTMENGQKNLEFQINLDSIMVADSALYSQENPKIIEYLNWITRVSLTIKKAKDLIQSVSIESLKDLGTL